MYKGGDLIYKGVDLRRDNKSSRMGTRGTSSQDRNHVLENIDEHFF